MAFDEQLAQRIREAFRRLPDLPNARQEEKRMFGGICFLVNGHMACGVAKDQLMLRLGNDGAAQALTEPFTLPMDFTGKPLKSMIYVEAEGIRTERQLTAWVSRATQFAQSLPQKPAKRKAAKKKAPVKKRSAIQAKR